MLVAAFAAGCGPSTAPDLVWGKRGVLDGDFVRPRAAVIDEQDRLWIVDFTARIQAYSLDGEYLGPTQSWSIAPQRKKDVRHTTTA